MQTSAPVMVMHQHKSIVNSLAKQVSSFHQSGTPFRIYHGNTNSTRPSLRTSENTLDVSQLNQILSISEPPKTCLCQPNVPMDALLTATLEHGLMPPVVPEFPGITVGGAFAGTAGESSSFKHGFFDRSVLLIQMILADGEVVTANENERQDLFKGAAGTFGTLGVLTLLEVRLVEARPYVELTYLPVTSIHSAKEALDNAMVMEKSGQIKLDFLDGIMYSPTRGVVMMGKMVHFHQRLSLTSFHRSYDQWFYLHAKNRASQSKPDLIPLKSYIFRYDRGAFWTGRYAYSYFLLPFNRLTRWLLDYTMNTRILYHGFHRSGLTNNYVIQDMATPAHKMRDFSDWLDDNSKHGGRCRQIYPRWLCPLKAGEPVSMNPHMLYEGSVEPQEAEPREKAEDEKDQKGDWLLNIGLWGPLPEATPQCQINTNRAIEAKLISLHGMKWMYAQTFYTKAEFWNIYDKEGYETLREKYKADSLPDVYAKVGPSPKLLAQIETGRIADKTWSEWFWTTRPFQGLYGTISALKGGDYLRKSKGPGNARKRATECAPYQ